MNANIIAVDIKHCKIYDFLKEGETKERLLQRADISKIKDVVRCKRDIERNPEDEYFKKCLSSAQETEFKIMTWEEFERFQKKFLLGKELEEINAEIFYNMLDFLPPLYWTERNGVEMFCMSKMYTGTYAAQYAHDKRTNKYYTKLVDSADRSTWICELLNNAV